MKLDLHELHLRAQLMSAAYEPTWERCEKIVKGLGYTNFEGFDESPKGGTEAFVASRCEEIVVCYRGSQDLIDWIRNLKFLGRTPFLGNRLNGSVHRGFYEAFRSTEFLVMRKVKRLHRAKARPVVYVGHSLGAAIAAQNAKAYRTEYESFAWLFGCPRIGNELFATEYNEVLGDWTHSIRNGNDIVTLSPLWNWPIGQQFYLGDKGPIYWPGFFHRVALRAKVTAAWLYDKFTKQTVIPRSFTDHFADRYRERAASYLEGTSCSTSAD